MKHPKEISLSEEAVDDLRSSIQSLDIDDSIKTIMIGLLDNHLWLQYQLQESKMSLSRLKSNFGIKSEKHEKITKNDNNSSSDDDTSEGDGSGLSNLKPTDLNQSQNDINVSSSKNKGHGRYKADDYTAALIVNRTLDALTYGGECPDSVCDGRVYLKKTPGVVIRITGGSLIQATRYNLERYRCSLCQVTFTASLPDDVSIKDKYDAKSKSVIVINRIQLGVPLYRRARFKSNVARL